MKNNLIKFFSKKYYFLNMAVIFILLSVITPILYYQKSNAYLKELKKDEILHLDANYQSVINDFMPIISDLLFLSNLNELNQFVNNNNETDKNSTAKEFIAFSNNKFIYDQIRYFDPDGKEIIRVNFNKGKPQKVAKEKLQDKSTRQYFKDTIETPCDKIYISEFTLNMENKKIEMPFKPVLRVGKPICINNNKKGAIIINYSANILLSHLKKNKNLMFINSDGYWLENFEDYYEWGFLIKERKNYVFQNSYPNVWKEILSSDNGQIKNKNGLFTWKKISPGESFQKLQYFFEKNKIDKSINLNQRYWILVSHIPKKEIKEQQQLILKNIFFLTFFILLISVIPTWLISQALLRKKMHQQKVYYAANFDSLTGLPNRNLFREKLNQTHFEAEKSSNNYALLYIDLNGFKQINDTLGHDAGDEVLQTVAKRLVKTIRQSDTAARLGGDEYIIILQMVKTSFDAQLVADKIIAAIEKDIEINNQKVNVGASIGISLYPEDGKSMEALIKKADTEMYKVKKTSK